MKRISSNYSGGNFARKLCTMLFQRLEDLRIDSDKTQQQIADLLNCKREVYRRYEKGTFDIPLWALIKLAEYYETSTDYILGLTNIKDPYPKSSK